MKDKVNETEVLNLISECSYYLQLCARERLQIDDSYAEKERTQLEKRLLLIKKALDFVEAIEDNND